MRNVCATIISNVNLRCLQQRTVPYTIALLIEKGGNLKMLNENIKTIRKSKGLSQEELAIKLNVVRQTISKWEQGLSVPDSDMLIAISEVFETPVSALLGETIAETKVDDLKAISEKLEIINLQLAKRKNARRTLIHWLLITLSAVIIIIFAFLIVSDSPYLGWNYSDPETAVLGVAFHSFEWLFVRIAPIILIGAIVGIFLTRKKG
jgi:putative transcriptional regulator